MSDQNENARELIDYSDVVLRNILMHSQQQTGITIENIPVLIVTVLVRILIQMSRVDKEFGSRTAQRCLHSLVTSLQLNNVHVDVTLPEMPPEDVKDITMHVDNKLMKMN